MNETKARIFVTQVDARPGISDPADFSIMSELLYYQDNMFDSAKEAINQVNR